MDFKFTEEQELLRKAAREFAEREFTSKLAKKCDESQEFPWELYKKAASLGFIGIRLPREYGGQGYGLMEEVIVAEEFTRVDSTLGYAVINGQFGSHVIAKFGSNEQKEKYLPRICRGEITSGLAITEPNHGSDISDMDTIAIKEGDTYVINGTKTFISNAPTAEFITVLCKTDLKAKPTHRGLSMIIVERGTKGLEVRKLTNKIGCRGLETGEISLSDVRVPTANLVGEENKGFYQALEFLMESRIEWAGECIGIARGAYERALSYAKERRQFGRPLADFQAIQFRLAEIAIKIEAARLLTYKAAWAFDNGRRDFKLSTMAKIYASEVAVEATNYALQIFGGYGYTGEHDIARYYRDARLYTIAEGPNEVLLWALGRELQK